MDNQLVQIVEYGQDNRLSSYDNVVQISSGATDLFVLRADGSVSGSTGSAVDVSGMTGAVRIVGTSSAVLGINSDLTVAYAGSDLDVRSDIAGWSDIRSVAYCSECIYGLSRTGVIHGTKPVGSSDNIDLTGWNDLELVKLFGSSSCLVGITKHGVTHLTRSDGSSPQTIWSGYVLEKISCSDTHILGLTDRGRLLKYDLGTTVETVTEEYSIREICAESSWSAYMDWNGTITTEGSVPENITVSQNSSDTYIGLMTTSSSIIAGFL